jgi:putative membrane-bound dehydrogenase-like protein
MMRRTCFLTLLAALFSSPSLHQPVSAETPTPPRVLMPGWKIELILSEPDLVTPVACAFDHQDRLLVIESHTHFPPEDYTGPKTDRIYAVVDSDGDGVLDRKHTYYQGGTATMGLLPMKDGSVIVATRSDVSRLRDVDGDGVAEQRDVLLELKTDANYPHNGLAGLTIDATGRVYVGQGENFGEPYELIAADGSRQIGSGEGGNVFRMRADGSQLERFATGFWNPFGMCFDPPGRLWVVGNDPDAMPPCRLLRVVEGGDYGFQFRFGRGGTHPLQAWDGELPETLPFTAGTGEAPCAVVPIDGQLWVTSWGDNRIERYTTEPNGFRKKVPTEVVVQGGPQFRPVGLAQADDGSIYFTDWVSRDYSVHGTGRLWRLSRTTGNLPPEVASNDSSSSTPRSHSGERRVDELLERLATLGDPFDRQAAVTSLSKHSDLDDLKINSNENDLVRSGVLAAWRWRELCRPESVTPAKRLELITDALEFGGEQSRQLAMRWAAERKTDTLASRIEDVLADPDLSEATFSAAIASLSYLKSGTTKRGVRDPFRENVLYQVAADLSRSEAIRALAIRMLPGDTPKPNEDELRQWIVNAESDDLSWEIIRLLDERNREPSIELLVQIATDPSFPAKVRADAIAVLPSKRLQTAERLDQLQTADVPAVVRRELRRVQSNPEQLASQSLPAADDLDSWKRLVGEGGDAEAGRRVFARSICVRCHEYSGRGATTGPSLSRLEGQTREKLIESILLPSREIGPLYVPWKVLTTDGEVRIGLRTTAPGVGRKLSFQDAAGEQFLLSLEQIEFHQPSDQSIMPNGLEKTMTIDEFRDLLAFLEPQQSATGE